MKLNLSPRPSCPGLSGSKFSLRTAHHWNSLRPPSTTVAGTQLKAPRMSLQARLNSDLPLHLAERCRVVQEAPVAAGHDFVLYWMCSAVRADENPALDTAVLLACQSPTHGLRIDTTRSFCRVQEMSSGNYRTGESATFFTCSSRDRARMCSVIWRINPASL